MSNETEYILIDKFHEYLEEGKWNYAEILSEYCNDRRSNLKEEHDIWILIDELFKPEPMDFEDDDNIKNEWDTIYNRLKRKDPKFYKQHIIFTWLERCYTPKPFSKQINTSHFDFNGRSKDENDNELSQIYFDFIRSGNFQSLKDYMETVQPLRIPTIEPLTYDNLYPHSITHRKLIKQCANAASNSPEPHNKDGEPDYEAAIYAYLSGNIEQLLKYCNTWSDYLWAYMKALIENNIEKEIDRIPTFWKESEIPLDIDLTNIVGDYKSLDEQTTESNYNLTLDIIFQRIKQSLNPKIKEESKYFYNQIIEYIILEKYEDLLEYVAAKGYQYPRFSVHLLLYLENNIENFYLDKVDCGVKVFTDYVNYLTNKRNENVALYCSRMPSFNTSTYVNFLVKIDDNDEKRKLLEIGKDLNLNNIATDVVDAIMERTKDIHIPIPIVSKKHRDYKTIDLVEVEKSEADIERINSLVLLDHDDMVKFVNALSRTFLVNRKLKSLEELHFQFTSRWNVTKGKDFENLSSSTINEYNFMSNFVDMISTYRKLKQSRDGNLLRKLLDKVDSLLTMLSEPFHSEDDDQMKVIINIYVPELMIMRQKLLLQLQDWDECLNSANLISRYYESLFTPEDMKEILKYISIACISMLKEGQSVPFEDDNI